MPPIKPKLVNRGPAGLLSKQPAKPANGESHRPGEPAPRPKTFNKIAPALKPHIVPIDSLTPDPNNARLHPDRNLESIMDSLAFYGQVKPVVVRDQTGVVMAGNGTMAAAKALGWTKLAAVRVPMTDAEAAGYGLADNRTAELARWDFEVVARLDRLITEAGGQNVGWSLDELEVLRCADWTPPSLEDGEDGFVSDKKPPIDFTGEQRAVIEKAIAKVIAREGLDEEGAKKFKLTQGKCLEIVCTEWMKGK